jgi:hypothetical protein
MFVFHLSEHISVGVSGEIQFYRMSLLQLKIFVYSVAVTVCIK